MLFSKAPQKLQQVIKYVETGVMKDAMKQRQKAICSVGAVVVNVEGIIIEYVWKHHGFGESHTDGIFKNGGVSHVVQWLNVVGFSIQALRNTTSYLQVVESMS